MKLLLLVVLLLCVYAYGSPVKCTEKRASIFGSVTACDATIPLPYTVMANILLKLPYRWDSMFAFGSWSALIQDPQGKFYYGKCVENSTASGAYAARENLKINM